MLPSWITNYVGLPFLELGRSSSGIDCWGLVKLVYKDRLDVMLPDYLEYSSVGEKSEVEAVINKGKQIHWEKVSNPEQLDVILFNIYNRPLHVGVVLDSFQFMHSPQDNFVRVENFTDRIWKNRVEGFYRYVR